MKNAADGPCTTFALEGAMPDVQPDTQRSPMVMHLSGPAALEERARRASDATGNRLHAPPTALETRSTPTDVGTEGPPVAFLSNARAYARALVRVPAPLGQHKSDRAPTRPCDRSEGRRVSGADGKKRSVIASTRPNRARFAPHFPRYLAMAPSRMDSVAISASAHTRDVEPIGLLSGTFLVRRGMVGSCRASYGVAPLGGERADER